MTLSIGQQLKQAREEQHLTLDKASEATKIRVPYLQAFETDDLATLPSPVQARGFLRNYAEYLGLDLDQLLAELRKEERQPDEIIGPADTSPESVTPATAAVTSAEAPPLSQPEVESAPQVDDQPEPAPNKPKRSGRKKNQVTQEQQVETSEVNSPKAVEPSPVVIEENTPSPVLNDVPQTASINDEITPSLSSEKDIKPDTNDNLWQAWLNRISSFIPARTKSESEQVTDTASAQNIESTDSGEEPVSTGASLESTQIFKEIGAELRKRRELLSLHLEEVERNTHVKAHYLEALENGAMEDLPSTVQTRGMLSNYATFLDLDVDALLLRYADSLQARHREKNPQKPVRQPGQPIVANIPPMRSFIAGDMIFGIGVAVLLIGFSIWGINRVLMIQSQRGVQPTAPSISDVLLASPDPNSITPTATLVAIEAIDGPTATIEIPTQNLNVNVQVNLVAVERTFMRVLVDGKEVFNGRVVPGTAYPFEAENQIEVLVGSGAAIRIVYNGRDLGLMGGLGQVINNVYTADEIVTPTAQPTPSPTRTAPVTSTSLPTLTPAPTNTAISTRTTTP